MSSEMSNDNSVKIPKFDGTNYTRWKQKFKAVLAIKGIAVALDPNFRNKLPAREDTVLDISKDDENAQGKALV